MNNGSDRGFYTNCKVVPGRRSMIMSRYVLSVSSFQRNNKEKSTATYKDKPRTTFDRARERRAYFSWGPFPVAANLSTWTYCTRSSPAFRLIRTETPTRRYSRKARTNLASRPYPYCLDNRHLTHRTVANPLWLSMKTVTSRCWCCTLLLFTILYLVKRESESLPVETHAARSSTEEHVVQVERSPGGEHSLDFAEEGLHVAQPPVAAPTTKQAKTKTRGRARELTSGVLHRTEICTERGAERTTH